MEDPNALTDKQLKFIDAYFKLQNITQICKTLNITKATYYNYLKDDTLKNAINNIRYDMLLNTTNYLQNCLNECSKQLMKIVKSKTATPQIKINAINSIFNNCNKLTEQIDILNKINNIEQQLLNQEQNINDFN